MSVSSTRAWTCLCVCIAAMPATGKQAHAQRIDNGVAVFATLDKVTARISKLEVPLNQSMKFGSLTVTPRACYSRPPTEPPKTTGFIEVEETQLDGQKKRIFSGWMFAESPGLNAVEHPVFDVWLTNCAEPLRPAAAAAAPATKGAAATAPARGAPAPAAGRPAQIQPGTARQQGAAQQPPPTELPPTDGEPLPPRRVRR
jgi:hypothetical protein